MLSMLLCLFHLLIVDIIMSGFSVWVSVVCAFLYPAMQAILPNKKENCIETNKLFCSFVLFVDWFSNDRSDN